MTGSLQVKRDTYQMVYTFKDETGSWRQRWESTGLAVKGNKRKAQEMLDARLRELEQQSTVALTSKKILFLDFLRSWLDEVICHDVRPYTFVQYRGVFDGHLCKFKPFHGVALQDLTPALLQAYFNDRAKTLSPNTLRKHKTNLHKALDYATLLGLIPFNPSDRIQLPRKQRYQGAKVLTPEQLQTLCRLFQKDPIETAVMLAVTYGMRRSEVCGLRWESVDFDGGTVFVCHTAVVCNGEVLYSDSTKTATSRRHLPLTASMRAYLLEVKARQEENKRLFGNSYTNSDYVCTQVDGTPISPDFVTHHFQRILKASELPFIRFHDLRHSAVNTLRKGGCDAKDIQSWLGHSDVSTTLNVYGHLLEGDLSRMGIVMDAALAG